MCIEYSDKNETPKIKESMFMLKVRSHYLYMSEKIYDLLYLPILQYHSKKNELEI